MEDEAAAEFFANLNGQEEQQNTSFDHDEEAADFFAALNTTATAQAPNVRKINPIRCTNRCLI